jgi:hypothetical protein
MAENENLNRQLQQQAAEQERLREDTAIRRCKHCGTDLEADALFCPQCGEQFGSVENTCQFCDTKTTMEFCPHCGKRVLPVTCPQCGIPSVFDACENCGTLLNQELAAFFAKEKPEPKEMSAEEARKIEAEFKQQPATPEFEQFQKRLIERQILLEERDYFNKREKRIIQILGARPFSLELPDPEEEAFRIKAYAALEKTVIERQDKLLQKEWERLFPEEKKVEVNRNGVIIIKTQAEIDEENYRAELERKREEMEKHYQELLSRVEDEVEAHRIAEEKRKEEERRQKEEAARLERERQKERERQRLEQEAYERRILGTYYYGNPGHDYEWLKLYIKSTSAADCEHYCNGHGYSQGRFIVHYDGYNISLTCLSLSDKGCPLLHSVLHNGFTGTVNGTGTIISGSWGGHSVVHYKY